MPRWMPQTNDVLMLALENTKPLSTDLARRNADAQSQAAVMTLA